VGDNYGVFPWYSNCGGKYSPAAVMAKTVVNCCLLSLRAIGTIFVPSLISNWSNGLVPVYYETFRDIFDKYLYCYISQKHFFALLKLCTIEIFPDIEHHLLTNPTRCSNNCPQLFTILMCPL